MEDEEVESARTGFRSGHVALVGWRTIPLTEYGD
jgi:hypothetical protein